jgi:hypothetical protein
MKKAAGNLLGDIFLTSSGHLIQPRREVSSGHSPAALRAVIRNTYPNALGRCTVSASAFR